MKRPLRLAVLAAASLLASGLLRAETPAPTTYVVLVGVGSFTDPAIHARPAAENDAKALYQLAISKQYLGANPANVKLLLSKADPAVPSEAASRETVVATLKWVVEKADKQDLVVIGFFGQGATVGDRTCYFLPFSTVKGRTKDALGTGELESLLEKLKSEKLLALVDVNYKGFTPETNSVVEPNILDFLRVFVGNEDKEEHTLPPGHVIFMASNTVAKHIDVEKHGIFAKCLVDALQGKADAKGYHEGYEGDGVVTVDELQSYLEKEIPALARVHGTTREEKEQAPLIWGSRNSHFPITRNPEVAVTTDAQIAKLAKQALAKDLIDEGTRLIGRMPKLKGLQDLRRNYVKLAEGQMDPAAFQEARKKIQAGMKLEREDSEAYADKVLRGCERVRQMYVKELNLGEMVGWAIKGMYRGLEESLPPDVKRQLDGVRDLKRSQLSDLLSDARQHLGKREDLDSNKDIDLSLRTMMFNLDPYTTYFDKEQVRQMDSSLTGRYYGIGIQIRRDMVRDGLLVVTPIKGSPAYRAGVRAGDLITEIVRPYDSEGKKIEPPEVITTKGMKTDEAVKKILGQPRTNVKLKIVREGTPDPIEIDLTRNLINVETVHGVKRKEDDSWEYTLDAANKIAYIRLTQFAPRSYEDMRDVVRQLQKNGVKGVILDLRFNPGGLLTAAVQICEMFIEDGLIVTIKPRSGAGEESAITKESKETFANFPMVCMVNGLSASGSEIVAACLQDHNRAVILGERSFGKGSVQNIMDFSPTGARIKLTTATFWRPNGKNLNKSSTTGKEEDEWGVKPDDTYEFKLTRAERDALFEQMRDTEIIPNRAAPKKDKPVVQDKQLEAALKYLQSQVKTAKK